MNILYQKNYNINKKLEFRQTRATQVSVPSCSIKDYIFLEVMNMKNYLKPQMELNQFNLKENVASIDSWVKEDANAGYATAGITTYLVNS